MENISVFEFIYGIFWLPTLVLVNLRIVHRFISMNSTRIVRNLKIEFMLSCACSICLLILGVCSFDNRQTSIFHVIGFILLAFVFLHEAYNDFKTYDRARNATSIELEQEGYIVTIYPDKPGGPVVYRKK